MLRPRSGLNARLTLTVGILTALMGLSIWLNFSASSSLERVRVAVTSSAAVIFANDDVFSLLQGLESSQRGYLLTRRPAYLDPYNESAAKLAPAMDKLMAAGSNDRDYKVLVDEIGRLVPLRVKEISRTLELAAQGEWDMVAIIIDSDIGKNSMSAIRQASNQLQDLAIAKRARTLEEIDQAQQRQRLLSIIIGALALLGALTAIFNLVRINAGLNAEVQQRRRVEAGLRDLERRNRAFFEYSSDYLYTVEERDDGEWVYTQINPTMARLFGMSDVEAYGRPLVEVVGEAASTSIANFRRCQETRGGVRYSNRAHFNGQAMDFDVSLIPLIGEDGAIRRILGSARDITQARITEAALRQSQKMEAVGQLTGGIAHDFNNLLQVVIGNLELAAKAVDDPRVKDRLTAALSAADRGTQLTRKLLTFARQAPSVIKVLKPSSILRGLDPIIRASLGESIALQLILGEKLWHIEADRTSLESVILNLTINARDAMPQGGKLKIEVANVAIGEAFARAHADAHAGDHVRITVSDTGVGIPAALMDKIFVPFFTTKEPGKGTGLGLATVYALARERGGFVDIESQEGLGTSVSLYFPRSDGIPTTGDPASAAPAGGSESILVVEDDRALLDTTIETLRRLGYAVEGVARAEEALATLGTGRRFDLLFTDVVMPGRYNGVVLADRAQALRPDLRILFMSGYIDDPAVREAAASGHLEVLQKPFRSEQLAATVRRALDRSEGRRRAGTRRVGGGRLDFRPAETGRSVLVVEDDALVRAVAVDALTTAGFRCIEAENAAEGLQCLRDEQIGINAMICDLNLPDQPGQVLISEAATVRASMPVVVTSGTAAQSVDAVIRDRPGVSILPKPYSPEMLVRLIADATR